MTEPLTDKLSSFLAHRDLVGRSLPTPFPAMHRGDPVEVLAVLERTVVVEVPGQDRKVLLQSDVEVDVSRLVVALAKRGERRARGPRRCADCRQTRAETEFYTAKSTYCVSCQLRRQRLFYQRPKTEASGAE